MISVWSPVTLAFMFAGLDGNYIDERGSHLLISCVEGWVVTIRYIPSIPSTKHRNSAFASYLGGRGGVAVLG